MNRLLAILTALTGLVLSSVAFAAPTLSADLQPTEVTLGQSARLSVKLSGLASSPAPALPQIDGLHISPAGQSSEIRIVNGQQSSTVIFTYRVTAEHAGDFDIPPLTIRGGGTPLRSDPLKLRVTAGKQLPQGAPVSGTSPGIKPLPNAIAPQNEAAFLRVERAGTSSRDHLYVGEMTPIAIRAYFREGVQVNLTSKPSLTDPAFTLRELSEEPDQQSTTIDGKRYRVLTWYAGLSGVKAGEHSLGATLDVTLGIPGSGQSSRSRSSLFNDPFFDSMLNDFFAPIAWHEISLASDPAAVPVHALPSEGRPPHFEGAVGQFEIGAFSLPAEMQTGDPVQVTVTVNGRGNFDRVNVPHLEPVEGWKPYAAKSRLEPVDRIGLEAHKIFEQPLVALEPGTRDVSFSLAYFDPERGEYRTATSEAVPMKITGSAISANAYDDPTNDASLPPSVPASGGLAPLRDNPGYFTAGFTPLYLRAWFLAVQGGVMLSALAGLLLLCVRRQRERHPDAARQRATARAVADQLQLTEAARRTQNGPGFFAAARRALQLTLADRWRCRPETITSEEIAQRLPRQCPTARLFAMADAVEFSGTQVHPDTFDDWCHCLAAALEELAPAAVAPSPGPPRHWGEVFPVA